MTRMPMIVLALALTGCGIGTPRDDRDARRPLEVPVTGPSAYVILTAADIDRGWDLLEVMNIELPPVQRSRIQARDLVSGGSPSMMIRFAGECAGDGGFVTAVRSVTPRRADGTMRPDLAGALNGTTRQHRSCALWLAPHDASTPAVARYSARLVSAYERAPVRYLMTLGLFSMVEGGATGIMTRVALRATAAPATPMAAEMPPGSGWPRTLLALTIWLLPFVVTAIVSI